MRKPRKNYTPVEKVAILRRHLIDKVPVSDLCDEHQLSAHPVLRSGRSSSSRTAPPPSSARTPRPRASTSATIAALRDKLQRKNEVIAELMEEHIQLKKELGEL